jgi:hypothetical protein
VSSPQLPNQVRLLTCDCSSENYSESHAKFLLKFTLPCHMPELYEAIQGNNWPAPLPGPLIHSLPQVLTCACCRFEISQVHFYFNFLIPTTFHFLFPTIFPTSFPFIKKLQFQLDIQWEKFCIKIPLLFGTDQHRDH